MFLHSKIASDFAIILSSKLSQNCYQCDILCRNSCVPTRTFTQKINAHPAILRLFKLGNYVQATATPHVLSRNPPTSPRVFEFLYGVEIRLYRSKIILSPRRLRGLRGTNDRGGRGLYLAIPTATHATTTTLYIAFSRLPTHTPTHTELEHGLCFLLVMLRALFSF